MNPPQPTWTLLAVATLHLILGGCVATAPDSVEPDLEFDVPDAWAASPERGEVEDGWWLEFQDPALSALIQEALDSNYDLREAAARVETAVAEARIAGAVLLPMMDTSVNAQRQRQNFSALPLPGGGTQSPAVTSSAFGVALNFRWEVDLWGRLRAGASAAAADFQSEQDAFRAAALSLAAQTAKAWFAVTEARLQVLLAEQTVESFRGTYRQAANRVSAGVQSPVDDHLAEANLASAEANLQTRREVFARTRRQLEVLLGRYPAGLVEGATDLPSVSSTVPVGVPADVIGRRPDIGVLERRLAASLKRVDAAEGALYPRLSLTGSTGTSSAEFDDLLSGDFFVWSIAGGLVQPLFEGGRLRAEVSAAEGRVQGAAAAFAQGVLSAFFEVEAALAAEAFLAGQEEALARAARAARQAVTVSENRYGQGVEPLLVVLESQRRALDAESTLLAVRRARVDNRLDLHLALGGGFEVLPPSTVLSRAETGVSQ